MAVFLMALFIACGIAGCSDDTQETANEPYDAAEDVDVGAEQDEAKPEAMTETDMAEIEPQIPSFSLADIPEFTGEPFVAVNGNVPDFTADDLSVNGFEAYSDLDSLGRCGVAYANIGPELMPTEARGEIGQVKPTGWHTVKYDCVDGKYLYNRCHLIGYQLTGENANEKNLITGTRYMNVDGMLPFEDMVADYIKETGNHVLYRVTPVFEGGNLVTSGVLMEAESVEDHGEGVLFNVYCYNAQPGVSIDYATGESALAEGAPAAQGIGSGDEENPDSEPAVEENTEVSEPPAGAVTYIVNTNTGKLHLPACPCVAETKAKNKMEFSGSRDEAISMGYSPCGNCKP